VRTLGRLFLGVAGLLIAGGVVYVLFADEPVGKVLLLLAGGLGLMIGGYLELSIRPVQSLDTDAGAGAATVQEGMYLPHASVWPFWLGVGALVVANGFALGLWGLIPGAVITAGAIVGFARQSRRRD
jgi:hypothetical protein